MRLKKIQADEKMPDSFYEWLGNCPVMWYREEVNKDSIDYTFIAPDKNET